MKKNRVNNMNINFMTTIIIAYINIVFPILFVNQHKIIPMFIMNGGFIQGFIIQVVSILLALNMIINVATICLLIYRYENKKKIYYYRFNILFLVYLMIYVLLWMVI